MSDIPIKVLTNDKHNWLLQGFSYMFNKFWVDDEGNTPNVEICGCTHPTFDLPKNFRFTSISHVNYPKDKWTNSLFKASTFWPDRFILFLEDYYIYHPVNTNAVREAWDLFPEFEEFESNRDCRVLRIDLSADRKSVNHKPYQDPPFIETVPISPYQMSFQCAIWSRDVLQDVLYNDENPWQSEINGTKRLNADPSIKVLGTTVHPVRYTPIWRSQQKRFIFKNISMDDYEYMASQGWLRWDQ